MTALELFARGPLGDLSGSALRALVDRGSVERDEELSADVRAILEDVRRSGDDALRALAERHDGVRLESLEVPRAEWSRALDALPSDVRGALERAARNLDRVHRAQVPADVTVEVEADVRVTRTHVPLSTAGVYAPGGTAAYPSSVLMGVVPAKAVGVDTVVVCSPTGPSGRPSDAVLAACEIAGADRLFALGGAGAVAALAYGTATVPSVDALVGPGNRWVTEAKRQVAGLVPIDAPAGPSEVLVVADASADPTLVAHELLAQAEHDTDAACVLVTDAPELARATEIELARLLADTPRVEIARAALATRGALLTAETLTECLVFAERFAPEHLIVMTRSPREHAAGVGTAGTVFVGASSSVAFGDYITGANHVLPTGGLARAFSGLSATHFLRAFTVQEIGPAGAAALADDVHALATAEGLPAHAAAAHARRQV